MKPQLHGTSQDGVYEVRDAEDNRLLGFVARVGGPILGREPRLWMASTSKAVPIDDPQNPANGCWFSRDAAFKAVVDREEARLHEQHDAAIDDVFTNPDLSPAEREALLAADELAMDPEDSLRFPL